ncbi:MAG: beta-propeller fold lactonase family protein [Armatimonadetes bacterium]|nr:beta-propeller fold lactonase family protein [Armatimonadota bacterium]
MSRQTHARTRASILTAITALVVAAVALAAGSPLSGPGVLRRASSPVDARALAAQGPSPAPGSRARVFVASEATNSVWVFEDTRPEPVRKIPTGHHVHNLALSPDGRWVATAARESDEVSLIDPLALAEVARIKVGRAPHDVLFSPDSRTLYVTQEAAPFISVIDVAARRRLPSLQVGIPQHDIDITPDGRELWLTVTGMPMRREPRRVRIVDLRSQKVVARINTGRNAHDVIFTPDGKEAWIPNSGIPSVPDNHITVMDVASRWVIAHHAVGRYPFHSPKAGKDGRYAPRAPKVLWFSDHGLRQILAVDRRTGKVVAGIEVGEQPFHISFGPTGLLYVAANASDWVAVIDPSARKRVARLRVPRPHGLAVLEIR